MRVTATGGSALIDEIEKLLDKAASAKSRAMRLADRAAESMRRWCMPPPR